MVKDFDRKLILEDQEYYGCFGADRDTEIVSTIDGGIETFRPSYTCS